MAQKDFSFDWTISPISREAFFDDYFEQRHLVVKRGKSDYYRDLLCFADIDHVITTMGLYGPEITVTKSADGGTDQDSDAAPATDQDAAAATDTDTDTDADTDKSHAPAIGPADYSYESGYIDPVRVAQLFADGGTIILSGLHERLPKLARFARALEATMSARVQTNIYMTPAGNQGFRPHYDSHDVLVLQLEGSKEWRIYDTPVELPLTSQGFAPGEVKIGEETDRFVLEPGDMAYLPRGLAHDAVATGETSLHVTTGLMFRTWADLVAEAARVIAHKDPAFRRALPPGFAQPGQDVESHEQVFKDLLARLADTAPYLPLIEEFRSDFIAGRLPRVEGQLAQLGRAGGLTGASRVGARPDLIYDLSRPEGADGATDHIRLSCHGAEITLPAHAGEALRHALATPDFRIADLPGPLDEAGKLVLIKRLVREGLVRIL